MKKQTTIMFLILAVLIVLLGGVGGLLILSAGDVNLLTNVSKSEEEIRTFADWTEAAVFQEVPAMEVEGTRIKEAEDYGSDVFLITVNGTELEHYKDYLKLLEKAGFNQYVNNGENGLDEAVYTATYTKDNLVVTVSQVINLGVTYITAAQNEALSEHLFYDESYVANNKENAQTTLTMLELYDYGNGFVFQLKNGHFVVFDGGMAEDAPNLLNYLESCTPEGEIPVIEGWFFSHGHLDHAQILDYFAEEPENAKRIYVDGIYFNQANSLVSSTYDNSAASVEDGINFAPYYFTTSDGNRPKIYRTQIGQRYYFNDLTMDVLFTQEQMVLDNYLEGYNASSTWLMVELEGQKLLFGADGGRGAMQRVIRIYSQRYLEADVFQALHHSSDTWNLFTDYAKCKTVLVPRRELKDSEANKYLIALSDEYYDWSKGSVVMTFPYVVGTAKILPKIWPVN